MENKDPEPERPNHVCGPESNCDGICVDHANWSARERTRSQIPCLCGHAKAHHENEEMLCGLCGCGDFEEAAKCIECEVTVKRYNPGFQLCEDCREKIDNPPPEPDREEWARRAAYSVGYDWDGHKDRQKAFYAEADEMMKIQAITKGRKS